MIDGLVIAAAVAVAGLVLFAVVRSRRGRYPDFPASQIPRLAGKYRDWLGPFRPGWFVEIGANDGESFSNTAPLADAGWAGLYVEPDPELAAACSRRHAGNPGVRVANVAAGAEDGELDLYRGGVLSTLVPEMVESYGRIDWAKGCFDPDEAPIPVRIVRGDELLAREGVPEGFDLLVVDVEGFEWEVISGIDLSRWRPRLVVIEIEDRHPDFEHDPKVVEKGRRIRERLERDGYELIWEDIINAVFRLTAQPPPTGRFM